MKRCAKCGKELLEGQKFCGYCGTMVVEEEPVVPEKPEMIRCQHCGREVPAGRFFCTECGYRLDKKISPFGPITDPEPETPGSSEPEQVDPEIYGKIAERFISQQTTISVGVGSFKCEDVNLLCSKLSVPPNEGRYLAIDTTMFGRGKNGFVIAESGIYSKQLFGNPQLIRWEEFLSTEIKQEEGKTALQINFKWPNKIEFVGSSVENNQLLLFFRQLQEFMRQTIELERN